MSYMLRVAKRRMKNNSVKNCFFMLSLLVSFFLLSFFIFFVLGGEFVSPSSKYKEELGKFTATVNDSFSFCALFLLIITYISITLHFLVKHEENKSSDAALLSVGAIPKDRSVIFLTELLFIYFPPTAIGVIFGIFPGVGFSARLSGSAGSAFSSPLYLTFISLLLILLIMISFAVIHFSVGIFSKNNSVINSIRKQSKSASENKHGYRNSRTFKTKPLTQRLANKSTDYYSKVYNRISLNFAISLFYPVTALLLLLYIGSTEVIIDHNPYDDIDVSGEILSEVNSILSVVIISFFILSVAGILNALLTASTQYSERIKTYSLYNSIGLCSDEIRKMVISEILCVVKRAAVYVILFSIVVLFTFGSTLGFA